VGKGLLRLDTLLGVEDQHALKEINSYILLIPGRRNNWGNIPAGSAFLNLFAKGCLSRLGND
jgi:hypothetical protein